MRTGHATGVLAEHLAAWFLRAQGYRILASRYKTPVGEVDLIARRGRVLVFAEVKARAGMEDALYAVQPRQSRRIIRAAEYYLSQKPADGVEMIRFDVLALSFPFGIRHIRAAFTA